MIVLIIIIVAIVAWYFLSNHDTQATKEALKLKERNNDQKKVIRYFLNDGCLSKHMSDQEYEAMLKTALSQFDFKKRALDKIGLDESELQEIAPVTFHDWLADKTTYGRQGKTTNGDIPAIRSPGCSSPPRRSTCTNIPYIWTATTRKK